MPNPLQVPVSTEADAPSERQKIDISADSYGNWKTIVENFFSQPWFFSILLFFTDVALVTSAYFIARAIRLSHSLILSPNYLLQVVTFFICILFSVALIGGYKARRIFKVSQFTAEFILAVILGAAVGGFIIYAYLSTTDRYAEQSRVVLFYTTLGYAVAALSLRFVIAYIWTRRSRQSPYLAIGTPAELANFNNYCRQMGFHNPVLLADLDLRIAEKLMDDEARDLHVSPRTILREASHTDNPKQSKPSSAVHARDFEGIILTDAIESYPSKLLERLARIHFLRIPVYSEETFFSEIWRKESIHRLDHSWAIRQNFQLTRNSAYRYIKIFTDYLIIALLLPIIIPLMLVLALAVAIDSGFPVFYWQDRVGHGERKFTLIKFRTMHVRPGDDDPYTRDKDARITRIGRFLRRTRLDELPQVFNVLRGDMSIVGPRAEWTRIVADYETKIPSYHLRHLVKPGITGWAQVNFRYGAGTDDAIEKLRYDLYYIKNCSAVLDIEILLKTILKVLSLGGK